MLLHTRQRFVWAALAVVFMSAGPARAACVPDGLPTPAPRDPVARMLAQQDACPKTAIVFRNLLKKAGARLEPTMINFGGFHRPDPDGFFFFEIASTPAGAPATALNIPRGDLLFGHLTAQAGDGTIVSSTSGLILELIAWDPDKQFYNFYELVNGAWSYRGDSKDILDDIQGLHRQRPASEGPFGRRLRCSKCHVNGGLLQKELADPHNDWFVRERPMNMDKLRFEPALKQLLSELVEPGELTKLVAASPQRLADSPGYRAVMSARSMQERLRPLFCAVEINIESDQPPVDDRRPELRVPSGFFVDTRLATGAVSVKRQDYDAGLAKAGSRLPGTPGRTDADHGWLTPVKANSDIVAVEALIAQGVIDREFAADVLAVDFTNPAFSSRRCALLKLVPDQAEPGFTTRLQDALRGSSLPGAVDLLANITDASRNAAFHQKQAQAFLASCQKQSSDPAAVSSWLRLLFQRRAEVSASEISQNPNFHILEDPGRVVFPEANPTPVAGRLALTPACQVQ
jgi:hypothetical protein